MKFDIAIDSRMIFHSGIGTYLRNVLPSIVSRFHTALLGDPRLLTQFPWYSKSTIIPVYSPIYAPQEHLEIPRRVPPATLFWSPHFNMPFFSVRTPRRLVTIHDVFHLAFPQQFSLPRRVYARCLVRNAIHQANRIITVSHFSKRELIRLARASASKITVIHNGIDHLHFKPIPPAHLQPIKQQFGLPDHFFLFVGNLKPHKNLSRLVKAFYRVAVKLPQWDLVVIGKTKGFITGDTYTRSLVEKHPSLAKRIHFLGEVPYETLPHFYNLASVFVFPSYYEGFGLPPLEAMACGCPVAAARAASIPEVCDDAALYFNPFQETEIARTLLKIASDDNLRQSLISRGLARAHQFQWQKSAQHTITIIDALLS